MDTYKIKRIENGWVQVVVIPLGGKAWIKSGFVNEKAGAKWVAKCCRVKPEKAGAPQ